MIRLEKTQNDTSLSGYLMLQFQQNNRLVKYFVGEFDGRNKKQKGVKSRIVVRLKKHSIPCN
jgi:hypothetical protein